MFKIDILIGTGLLLLILVFFTIFTYYAPDGSAVMSALATAAIATFLVEALQGFVLGDILEVEFLQDTGHLAGTLSGVIVGFLVALSRKISAQNSALLAVSFAEIGLIPAMVAAYLVTFVIRFIEKKITNGLDFIVIVILCIPLARYLGVIFTPLVDGSLLRIGAIIDGAMSTSPLIMGLILGGIVTVVGTSPLSSMALTAMLGLTGVPMAVAALTAFGSSFMNTTILHRLKIGSLKSVISIAIEPLSKADLVSANPVPIYVTNFIGGGLAGILMAYSGLVNDAPGTAAPTPGLLVMFGFNPALEVVKYAILVAAICFVVGIIMSFVFKNYPVRNSEVLGHNEAKKQ